ncbi:unnamed protein product [Brassicogethes aeneus]|uniref:Uncharacterized protein n=1 Tax=Brassicogethes aeneus TaxID=1431903 RepID=A0A9P0BBS5_BRAAE|nr:unnamed protein product [Brassicogethes aeneus]
MAFPITEIILKDVRPFFYQAFYLYLYLGSIAFVWYMHAIYFKENTLKQIIKTQKKDSKPGFIKKQKSHPIRYGSFYLRLGAIAFGIGSMVYSGLEFGQYFELKKNVECHSNILQAITPATRMVLTLVQVNFIFLNNKDFELDRHRTIARFGLMHMIATNLCEWLNVLVEETKHEINHLGNHTSDHTNASMTKKGGDIMGSLVTSASPFLFPCTIEYSLICAVILFEMWKKVKTVKIKNKQNKEHDKNATSVHKDEKITQHYNFSPLNNNPNNSNHYIIDCSNTYRGLFAGIMVIVLTIISLMFFVLAKEGGTSEIKKVAEFEVSIVELILYIITTIVVVVAMFQMRALKYDKKIGVDGRFGIGLDNTLLLVAQTGMFIYCMFSIIGYYFNMDNSPPIELLAEIFSFIQTCLQTMFVLDGWSRKCRNMKQAKNKPGRELITFLIVANMAMWIINTLEKNRAEFRQIHLKFFGDWTWTIITHITMPLAIFYRFHSTICLVEIWRSAYQFKATQRNSLFSLI